LPNGRILLSQRHRARAGSVGDGSRPSLDAKGNFAPMRRGVKTLLDQSATRRSIIASATLGLSCPARRQQIDISKVTRKPVQTAKSKLSSAPDLYAENVAVFQGTKFLRFARLSMEISMGKSANLSITFLRHRSK
jgi:hypothetical protein